MIMHNLRAGLLAATLAMPGAALAAEPDSADAMFAVTTAAFTETVTSANAFEIRSSEMAQRKATSADIKAFAAQMIADHVKAQDGLDAASGRKAGAAEPTAPKHAAMLKLLEGADGAQFEMLYIDMQAGAHLEAVALFRTFARSGDDAALVSFAKETLPTLEMHASHIAEIVARH